jgi:glycosyltransferase involved in cell wall biosynthesis
MPKALIISNYSSTVSVRPEAEAIIGLSLLGWEIDVMTFPGAAYIPRFREFGINVIEWHPEKKRDPESIQRIREHLIEGKHDILHLFNSKAALNGIPAAKGLNTKILLYRGYTGNIHWYDPTAYFKYLSPNIDGVWCIAEAIQKLILRNLFFQKSRKGIKTITKGHALKWYADITPLDLSAEFGIPADAFVVTCSANARKMKGIPYLIEATYSLPPNLPIYFLLIGNNMDEPSIVKQVQGSPYRDKIIFTGYRHDALRLVKAADTFVLASLFGEAITKAVIEAMSLEVCPIITDIPGNKELVIHNESGFVVPPRSGSAIAKAILYLYENTSAKNNMATKAKLRIEQEFNATKTVHHLDAWYRSFLA